MSNGIQRNRYLALIMSLAGLAIISDQILLYGTVFLPMLLTPFAPYHKISKNAFWLVIFVYTSLSFGINVGNMGLGLMVGLLFTPAFMFLMQWFFPWPAANSQADSDEEAGNPEAKPPAEE
jgi:hypothetical protein